MFYHIKNLQSTKTVTGVGDAKIKFYHIKNLQSTKTYPVEGAITKKFYHIKNLQSTKTKRDIKVRNAGFITLRIYKVLKPQQRLYALIHS